MIDAMKYWVTEIGIDGYRCDYAEGVPDAFWKKAIAELRTLDNNLLMLAEGGKTHDGENTAQSGAVEVAPYQQHIGNADQTVDADIHHYRPGAEHTQIIVGRPACGAQQAPVSGPHGPCGIAAAEGADEYVTVTLFY